jgi:hypothetical protein
MALTAKQQRFVVEYLVDLNATQAAIRAGFSARRAREYAYQLMQRADVAEAIHSARTDLSERTKITQEKVLERLWMIATADPNELSLHRRVCCRHCFGKDHAYQWDDEAEFDDATAKAMKTKGAMLPTDEGGYGFDKTERPRPKCPKCKGEAGGPAAGNSAVGNQSSVVRRVRGDGHAVAHGHGWGDWSGLPGAPYGHGHDRPGCRTPAGGVPGRSSHGARGVACHGG